MANEKLREAVKESGYKYSFLASKVGISKRVFSDRMQGRSQWKASEIYALSKELKLTPRQRDDIFFTEM